MLVCNDHSFLSYYLTEANTNTAAEFQFIRNFHLQTILQWQKKLANIDFSFFNDTNYIVCAPSIRQSKMVLPNGAELLAIFLAKQINAQYVHRLLKKKSTQMHDKSAAARRKTNLNIQIKKRASVKGNILLVDDVRTTGTTLMQSQAVLLKAGAKQVTCLTFAYQPLGFI